MTGYRTLAIGIVLACGLTACSGDNGEKVKEGDRLGAVSEQPAATPDTDSAIVPGPPANPVTSGSAETEPGRPPAQAEASSEPVPTADKKTPAPKATDKETTTGSVYGGGASGATGSGAGTSVKKPQGPKSGDRKELSWYYMKKNKGQVPGFPGETKTFTDDMKALWVGTGKKVYLTIDTGGDLGDIATLVKALKDNNAKANFFIAGYNVKKNPDYIRQLVKDGHLVANHTMTHSDMNTQTDEEVRNEIRDYEKLYKEVTGEDMRPFFRFPYGKYSKHLLELVSDMGYTSVFWSTAMRDWEPRKNGADDPYNDIMNNLHDGNIILMHQGSPENIEALDRIIKAIQKAGYTLALLDDIEPPQ
ncbi:peptidoglycan-N-acetylmuramic acid deacetylase [Paenibacillus sp. UNCCL117]|uniref:polysaccharide deacetylase family protein n=1 Tax=unclassified Paenibacillus TaxID=185978 RepID=UPI00088F7C1B|nr:MULTISPECIES: polysaccharide deacetylase family protein [unclassified Paenibacillus]SDC20148.1 peptidoglycan-N-acetylmuramic acid deacetylase [Paenibacillus sp. cl123]SFW18560.1 peptidoglycan-N-acetylmuramic acid deacetylase [Paenibacillus sp. UNCCL117]